MSYRAYCKWLYLTWVQCFVHSLRHYSYIYCIYIYFFMYCIYIYIYIFIYVCVIDLRWYIAHLYIFVLFLSRFITLASITCQVSIPCNKSLINSKSSVSNTFIFRLACLLHFVKLAGTIWFWSNLWSFEVKSKMNITKEAW